MLYLTEEEIAHIETLNENSVLRYISDMSEDKKRLVMKQYSKERAILQWKTIAQENYN